jgi:alanyl-tRNA synthetase
MQSSSGATVTVRDVKKAAGGQLFIHKAEVATGTIKTGETVAATIDKSFRRWVRANHTATHLLQAALKKVLGDDVAQQGSLVRNDGFRFDFSLPRRMTAAEIEETEALLNRWIEVRSLSDFRASGPSGCTFIGAPGLQSWPGLEHVAQCCSLECARACLARSESRLNAAVGPNMGAVGLNR